MGLGREGRVVRFGRSLAGSDPTNRARWAFGCLGAAYLAMIAVGCLASGVLLLHAVRARDLGGSVTWLVSALALAGAGALLALIVVELARPRWRRGP